MLFGFIFALSAPRPAQQHALQATDSELSVCSRTVSPVDPSPKRSPQATHSVLHELFTGKAIVEIGTRHGDGMACFVANACAAGLDPPDLRLI